MSCPFHPPCFDHPNNICWPVQITKLLFALFSPVSCHFLPLRSKTPSSPPHSRTSPASFSRRMTGQASHPYKTMGKITVVCSNVCVSLLQMMMMMMMMMTIIVIIVNKNNKTCIMAVALHARYTHTHRHSIYRRYTTVQTPYAGDNKQTNKQTLTNKTTERPRQTAKCHCHKHRPSTYCAVVSQWTAGPEDTSYILRPGGSSQHIQKDHEPRIAIWSTNGRFRTTLNFCTSFLRSHICHPPSSAQPTGRDIKFWRSSSRNLLHSFTTLQAKKHTYKNCNLKD